MSEQIYGILDVMGALEDTCVDKSSWASARIGNHILVMTEDFLIKCEVFVDELTAKIFEVQGTMGDPEIEGERILRDLSFDSFTN